MALILKVAQFAKGCYGWELVLLVDLLSVAPQLWADVRAHIAQKPARVREASKNKKGKKQRENMAEMAGQLNSASWLGEPVFLIKSRAA